MASISQIFTNYNIDKTGFRIRVITGRVVITHLSTNAVYLAGPNNRES